MGMDVRVTEREAVRCPHCGAVVTLQDVCVAGSCGSKWYDFLKKIGYYVPYEERTDKNDWYGKDMELTIEQAMALANFAAQNSLYGVTNAGDIESVVAKALMHGNTVVINADW